MKVNFSCVSCNADFSIKHDLGEGYVPMYCCFCGEEIQDDDYLDETEDYEEDE